MRFIQELGDIIIHRRQQILFNRCFIFIKSIFLHNFLEIIRILIHIFMIIKRKLTHFPLNLLLQVQSFSKLMKTILEHLTSFLIHLNIAIFQFHLILVSLHFLFAEHATYFLSHNHDRFKCSLYGIRERLKEDIFRLLRLFRFTKQLYPNIVRSKEKSHTKSTRGNRINFNVIGLFIFKVNLNRIHKLFNERLLKSWCYIFLIRRLQPRAMMFKPQRQQIHENFFARKMRWTKQFCLDPPFLTKFLAEFFNKNAVLVELIGIFFPLKKLEVRVIIDFIFFRPIGILIGRHIITATTPRSSLFLHFPPMTQLYYLKFIRNICRILASYYDYVSFFVLWSFNTTQMNIYIECYNLLFLYFQSFISLFFPLFTQKQLYARLYKR